MSKTKNAAERRKKIQAKRKQLIMYKESLVAKILTADAPELRSVCQPHVYGTDTRFIEEMKEVLAATTDGAGLAASQIGVLKTVCILRLNTGINEFITLINPEIIEASQKMETEDEGCLSYRGIVRAISRHCRIRVKYYDEQGKEIDTTFTGFASRVIQHEMDHFLGKCRLV
jgi:peptide deformylase